MIDYACRLPSGALKLNHGSRQVLYCPDCQFEYQRRGCIFAPTQLAPSTPPGQPQGARATNNLTGGTWTDDAILERIVEYHARHGKWPDNTTAFRDSPALPHSQTVTRHFGDIGEAVRQAQELKEREDREYGDHIAGYNHGGDNQ